MMSDTTPVPNSILCNIAHSVSGSNRTRTLQFAVLAHPQHQALCDEKYFCNAMLQFQKRGTRDP